MSAITLQSIETTVGNVLATAVSRAKSLEHSVAGVVHTLITDAEKLAPTARTILSVVAPQDIAALDAVVGLLNVIDQAVQGLDGSVSSGVTVQIPQAALEAYAAAKSAVLSFENSL